MFVDCAHIVRTPTDFKDVETNIEKRKASTNAIGEKTSVAKILNDPNRIAVGRVHDEAKEKLLQEQETSRNEKRKATMEEHPLVVLYCEINN